MQSYWSIFHTFMTINLIFYFILFYQRVIIVTCSKIRIKQLVRLNLHLVNLWRRHPNKKVRKLEEYCMIIGLLRKARKDL